MKTENAAVADQQKRDGDKKDEQGDNPCENLLKRIQSMREEAGGEVNDEEFTRLLREARIPEQDGFTFLSYCDRFVMFTVPHQQADDWYEEKGKIKRDKLEAAKKIGEKYEFIVSQPPDVKNASSDNPNPHHRLQLSNPLETIVIIHPQFLKIRIYTLASNTSKVERPFKKCELLKDLAGLYSSKGRSE
jgi:hypothetical protein